MSESAANSNKDPLNPAATYPTPVLAPNKGGGKESNKTAAAYRLDHLRSLFNQFESMVLTRATSPTTTTNVPSSVTAFSPITSFVSDETEALTTTLTVEWATALDSAIERSEKTILLLLLKMVERLAVAAHLPALMRAYTLYAQGLLVELEEDFHQAQLYYSEALTLLAEQTGRDQPGPAQSVSPPEEVGEGLASPVAPNLSSSALVDIAERLKLALTVRLGVALVNQNEQEKAATLLWPLLEQWQARRSRSQRLEQVAETAATTAETETETEVEGSTSETEIKIERDKGNGQLDGLMLSAVGRVYYLKGDFEQAIEYTEQALQVTRQANDRVGESRALDRLGVYYGIQNRYEESCRYFEAAIALRTALGNTRQLGGTYINLGLSYAHLGQPHRTIEAYNIGLTLIKQLNNHRGAALTCINLAQVYKEQKEPAAALAAALEALEELAKLEAGSNSSNNPDSSIPTPPRTLPTNSTHNRASLSLNVGTTEPALAVAALAEIVSDNCLLGRVSEARYYWQELSRLAPPALAQKISPARRAAIYNGLSEASLHILILAENSPANTSAGLVLASAQELAELVLDYHRQAVKLYEEVGDQDSLRLMLETEAALLLAPSSQPAKIKTWTAVTPPSTTPTQPGQSSRQTAPPLSLAVGGRLSYQELTHQLLGDWWAHFWSNLTGGAGPDNLRGWEDNPAGVSASNSALAANSAGPGSRATLSKRQNRLQLALVWARWLFEQGYSEESREVYLTLTPALALALTPPQNQPKGQDQEPTLLELAAVELASVQPVELIEHYSLLATLVPAVQGLKWVEAGLLLLKKANAAQFPKLRDKKKKLELLQKELKASSNRR